MFSKTESVEEHIGSELRPKIEEEMKFERDTTKPIEQKFEKKLKSRVHKNVQKLLDKKELEFSFHVKEKREKIPEIEEVRKNIDEGEDAIAIYLKAGRAREAKKLKD